MATYGYIRKDYIYPTLIQMTAILGKGCDELHTEDTDIIYETKLMQLLKVSQKEDIILVYNLKVFGKTLHEFQQLLTVIQTKQLRLVSLEDQVDTAKPTDILTLVNLLINLDRYYVSERTKIGLEQARQKGTLLGRPKIAENTIKKIQYLYSKHHYSVRTIATLCEVSVGTVHKYIRLIVRQEN